MIQTTYSRFSASGWNWTRRGCGAVGRTREKGDGPEASDSRWRVGGGATGLGAHTERTHEATERPYGMCRARMERTAPTT